MGPGANAQAMMRLGNVQFLEEYLGHILVVVLPRMKKRMTRFRSRLHGPSNCRSFYELRASTDYADELQCKSTNS